jgi:glycosyltransferase involved in cell wall biosynthesis
VDAAAANGNLSNVGVDDAGRMPSKGIMQSKIRVLILFSSSEIGGAERSLSRMALNKEVDGILYQFATVAGEGAWSQWIRSEGAPCSSFEIFRGSKISIGGLAAYFEFCRKNHPDIVYAIGLRASWVASAGRILFPRLKLVQGLRSTYPAGSEFARVLSRHEKILRFFTSGYIANSRQGAADLSALAPKIAQQKIQVIPNGVVAQPAARVASGRGAVVAVVANIIAYKGHEHFLEVIQLAHARFPKLQVLLIGRNDLGGSLESAIRERGLSSIVKSLGYQPSPELLVREARVSALPSQQIEGCPTSVLESMSIGVPVVAYDVGGLKEIIENDRTGVLVPLGDARGFANALVNLLTDEEFNDRLGLAARTTVQQRFSIRACARDHARYWTSLFPSMS